MYKYNILFWALFIASLKSFAQFTGGDSDGYSDGLLTQSTCPQLVSNFVFYGGNTDGYSDGVLTQSTCPQLVSNFVFYGGNTDGYSDGVLTQSNCPQLVSNFVFNGGNADGYSNGLLTQSNCPELVANFVFNGGNADGYSNGLLTQSNCPELVSNFVFYGGNTDGYSNGLLTQSNCPELVANFVFNGGNNDGYSNGLLTQSNCPELVANFVFNGGNTDGFSLGLLTQTVCPNLIADFVYYGGNADGFSNVTLTGYSPSSAPTSISGTTTICNGNSTTLTKVGGVLGIGATYKWYSGSCGGTSVGSGASIIVSPTSTTTYFVRAEGVCSNTACASVTVTVTPTVTPSVTSSVTSGTNPACNGSSVTFTAVPTNGGAGPTYQWTKNGSNIVAATSVTYTGIAGTDFVTTDIIRVVMTSNAICPSPATATSAGTTMTVTPPVTPTISISSSQTNLCTSGIVFTSSITNGGSSPAYQWKRNGTNISGETNATYSATNLVNGDLITCQLTSNATCISPTVVLSNSITVTLTGATTTWLGLTNDWSVVSPVNWNNGYPSSNVTAIIPSGTPNQPQINGIVECFNVEIQAGASLTINAVNQLNVYGKFTNNGTFNAGFGSVEFLSCSGSSAQAHGIASTNGTTTTFFNIRLDDLAGLNLTANANITGALTLTNGTFNNASNVFTFKSTASATARIAPVAPTANYVGNIIMERFAPGPKTGWAQLGTPIQGATLAQWQDDFATSGYTGATGSVSGFVSVYTYNEPTPGAFDANGSYLPATNVTNSIPVGNGFWLYLGTGSVNTANITIDVTGQPKIGNFSFNPIYTNSGNPFADGYNLVANPYPSAIDWLSPNWTKTNINNAVYMYQADNGQYASFVNGIATNGGSRFIASSQGFYIQANAASPVLNITENAKSSANPVLIKEEDPANVLRITIHGLDSINDEMVIHLNEAATSNFDGIFDAKKMFSNDPTNPSISSINNANDLSINSLPFSGASMSIPVRVTVGSDGMYNLSWNGMEGFPEASCFVLEDLDNGTKTTLEKDAVYYFNATAGFKAPRFMIHVSTPLPRILAEASCSNTQDGRITLTNPSNASTTVQLKDGSGNLIKEAVVNGTYTFDKLATGTYQLSYPSSACGAMIQTVNVTAAKEVSANFETSANTAYTNEAVTFSSPISKGNNITWDFGDGNTAVSEATISHKYQSAGVYKVSMTNQKGECSSTESKVLNITEGSSTLANSMDVNMQNGIFYAVFYFNEISRASISIVNALGQEVAVKQQYEGKNGRVRLQLDNAAEGVYLVTLTSGKESITKKIVK
jgi:hypothetical protein